MTTAEHPPENLGENKDIESALARMYEITKTQEQLEEERVELREWVAENLQGSSYFIDPLTGEKRYGYVVTPEPIDVDLDALKKHVPAAVYEEVLKEPPPPAVDKAKFKKAVETQRITPDVFVKVAKKGKGTPHVRFGDPAGPPPKF